MSDWQIPVFFQSLDLELQFGHFGFIELAERLLGFPHCFVFGVFFNFQLPVFWGEYFDLEDLDEVGGLGQSRALYLDFCEQVVIAERRLLDGLGVRLLTAQYLLVFLHYLIASVILASSYLTNLEIESSDQLNPPDLTLNLWGASIVCQLDIEGFLP